jgi:hypothetical protein
MIGTQLGGGRREKSVRSKVKYHTMATLNTFELSLRLSDKCVCSNKERSPFKCWINV